MKKQYIQAPGLTVVHIAQEGCLLAGSDIEATLPGGEGQDNVEFETQKKHPYWGNDLNNNDEWGN